MVLPVWCVSVGTAQGGDRVTKIPPTAQRGRGEGVGVKRQGKKKTGKKKKEQEKKEGGRKPDVQLCQYLNLVSVFRHQYFTLRPVKALILPHCLHEISCILHRNKLNP